jgi:hypothetical protein
VQERWRVPGESEVNPAPHGASDRCFWRWRFQPVTGIWGHLGLDYSLENPNDADGTYYLRHVDYGLPGDRIHDEYRQCIALHSVVIGENGDGWPPLRTPFGRVFTTSEFFAAPHSVADFLMSRLPRFWGRCGCYRLAGPNSNTGLRRAVELCERETGYRFQRPPLRMRVGAWGWSWPGALEPHNGPCPGYFESARFRLREPSVGLPVKQNGRTRPRDEAADPVWRGS